MPLRCPRCATLLDTFTRHGAPGATPIAADMCLACGGLWLDGGEVAVAYPGLSVLEERRGDVLAIGQAGAGIAACPRCNMPAMEVPFFDVRLDLCPDCHGVWIDGDEIEALSLTMDRGDGLPVPTEVVGGYRTAAAGVMTKHVVTCVACEKQVPLRASHATKKGAMCEACADQQAASEIPFGDDSIDESVVPKESAMWQFLCDVGSALGAVLAASARCSACGHRRSSGCSC